mmetsp:Transcript_56471/g.138610  ORF Transcript_56471/g.138610 Transcript_56471/m.138610 type:complete len:181 (-) Transcript_56471:359-901(-)
MGKANKGKKKHGGGGAARYNPYGRDTTRITDLCDMLSTTVAGVKAAPSMEDDEREQRPAEAGGGEEEEREETAPTRGKVLQRHKREWKELRARLEDMKAHKKAMGAATLEKKNAKKVVAKEIKRMQDELAERHKKELEEFDLEQKAREEAVMDAEAEAPPAESAPPVAKAAEAGRDSMKD